MIKHINKLMFLFAILVLASCIKDSEEFVPINGERSVTGDIFGIVTDTIGQPVEGALVFFGSRTKTTNQLGVYQFKNVKIDVKHNFLNIEKAGYFKATKTFRSVKEKSEILLKTLLMAKDFDRSINSEEGGIVEKGRTTLTFPAGSIVDEATGELYSGEVKVALQFLYPNDALIDQMMPGDLTAVDKDGIYSVLTSFGMNYVELQSESGAKLQIKEGKSVTMTSNVPLALLDDAPSEIKMWSFDTNTGLWKEEGVGQLSDGAYTGEVTHFSCWNYDSSLRSIIVNGRVVDQDGNPISSIHVSFYPKSGGGGGHGNTNFDGTFAGPVARDVELVLTVGNYYCNFTSPVYEEDIGPFTQDTDIGDIVVEINNDETLKVIGTLVNCDLEPVSNGYVSILGHYIFIDDGVIDLSIPYCNENIQPIMVGSDLDALTMSSQLILDYDIDNTIGVLSACEQEINHFTMNCDALNYHETALFELFSFASKDSLSIIYQKECYGYHLGGEFEEVFYIAYNDAQEDYSEAEFTIKKALISVGAQGEQIASDLNVPTNTVNIIEYNATDNFIRGVFQVVMKDQSNVAYDYYGTFKLQVN